MGDQQDGECCGGPVLQLLFSPLGRYFAISLFFYLKVRWGAGEFPETRIRNISSLRLVHSVQSGKWREKLKLTLNLMGRRTKDERLISETFITTGCLIQCP